MLDEPWTWPVEPSGSSLPTIKMHANKSPRWCRGPVAGLKTRGREGVVFGGVSGCQIHARLTIMTMPYAYSTRNENVVLYVTTAVIPNIE